MAFQSFLQVFFLALISFLFLYRLMRYKKGCPKSSAGIVELLLNVHRVHDWCTETLESCKGRPLMFDFLGDGIFNSDMDLWKNQRIAAKGFMRHHLFHQFLLRTTRDKVEMELMPIIDHAAKHGLVINLEDIFQRFTFDSACILVTGYDPSCLSLGWRQLFNVDEVKNLVYLHGALCEALRFYPPVPFNHKEPVKPDMLPSGHP
ncbi:hypothetical protein Goari_025075, partial [Gossypium aridum]|nr:hypothetical protein [Gossypium aridum]